MSKTSPTTVPAAKVPRELRPDAPEWDDLFGQYRSEIYRHALYLARDHDDAEDLMQDVFVKAYRNLDKFQSGNFAGWIHQIVRNTFLDRARRAQRIRFDGFDDAIDSNEVAERLASPSTEDTHLETEIPADIAAALRALPEAFSAPVVLADLNGLSYEEVSDRLGIPLGTVRSRIHRGRGRLREALAHRAPVAAVA